MHRATQAHFTYRASAYFPGTSMLYVPGVWFGLPPWYTSVLIAATIVTLIYLVTTEIFDGVAGILAALLALSHCDVAV